MSDRRRAASEDLPHSSPAGQFLGGTGRRGGHRAKRRGRPSIEALEAKLLLSTLYVDKDWSPVGQALPYFPDGPSGPAGQFGVTAFNNIQAALSHVNASNTLVEIVADTGGQPATQAATTKLRRERHDHQQCRAGLGAPDDRPLVQL